MLLAAAAAVAGLYRGLCFIHEISHQNEKALPHFEAAWNLLMGYPLLMPSFVYVGVHPSHHKLSTYGTSQDPEYLPFAENSWMTVLFALESFLIPVALGIRFLFLSAVGFVSAAFQRWLVVHFSSLTMNLAYRREATPELVRTVRTQSAIMLGLWLAFAAMAWMRFLPWRFFIIWLSVSSAVSFVNTLRTLGAHAYESPGDPMDREGQLRDSIDTPGALWTELWAPVGLRYHALHHYFPGIPYHNLRKAWRRLSLTLPPDAVYHRVRSRGLARSLGALYRKGRSGKGH
jgi:fatty acid desaturase